MTIEDLIKIPSGFKKVVQNLRFEEHRNSCETRILTWRDENGQITHRSKIDKKGNGWSFCRDSQNIIWFYLIENNFSSLNNNKIAICRFSEKSKA